MFLCTFLIIPPPSHKFCRHTPRFVFGKTNNQVNHFSDLYLDEAAKCTSRPKDVLCPKIQPKAFPCIFSFQHLFNAWACRRIAPLIKMLCALKDVSWPHHRCGTLQILLKGNKLWNKSCVFPWYPMFNQSRTPFWEYQLTLIYTSRLALHAI